MKSKDNISIIEGFLTIYNKKTREILFRDYNFIPYAGRRHIAQLAYDPVTYVSNAITHIGIGWKDPLTSLAEDVNRKHLESATATQVAYLDFDSVTLSAYPGSTVTFVASYAVIAPINLSEEGLFPVVPWDDTLFTAEENEIFAYKQISPVIPLIPSMSIEIHHEVRFGSNT